MIRTTSVNQLPVDMSSLVNRKPRQSSLLSTTILPIKVDHKRISLLRSNCSCQMETAALPVNMVQFPPSPVPLC